MLNRVTFTAFLVFCCFNLQGINGLFFSGPDWDTLKVTFGVNLLSKWVFNQMPMTRKAAEFAGWTQIGNKDASCSAKFQGYRYILDKDPAVILLYDVNGYIAGIQSSFQESLIHPDALYWFKQSPMFTAEKISLKSTNNQTYTLTAYLVDPDIICSSGRTRKQFDNSPGGDNLYLKNGTENVLVPKNLKDLKGTSWTKGKCFRSMGLHYWYNTSKYMNCDYFQPVFLMYNNDKLTGFGWAAFGMFSSPRYEHPTKSIFSQFIETVPDCLNTYVDKFGAFSTLHIYMNTDPLHLLC